MRLAELLAALPDGALLPVGWLREQLGREPGETTPGDPDDAALLTVPLLAARLHRSPSTARAWVATGRFAGAVKVGRGWLIPESAVSAFLDGLRPETPSQDRVGPAIPTPAGPRGHPRPARTSDARVNLGAWREVRRP